MVKLSVAILAIATARAVLAAPQGKDALPPSPDPDPAETLETLEALRSMTYPGALEDPVLVDKLGLLLTAPEKVGHYMGEPGAGMLQYFNRTLYIRSFPNSVCS
jgi:hypothetical protein